MTRDEFTELMDARGIVFVGDAAYRVAQLVAAAEREACAKICEEIGRGHGSAIAKYDCAIAIRARSTK